MPRMRVRITRQSDGWQSNKRGTVASIDLEAVEIIFAFYIFYLHMALIFTTSNGF